MARWLFVLGIFGVWQSGNAEKYDNHTLIKLFPTNESQFKSVLDFNDPQEHIEVLKRSRDVNDSLDLLVPLEKLPSIENYAKEHNLRLEVKARNYGRMLDIPDRTPKRRNSDDDFVFKYHSHREIHEIIESLAKKHPQLITLQTLGASYQGRKMTLVKISSNPAANNPVIFLEAGIHAREWVAPAMALYIINRLTSDFHSRDDLNGVDWYILPVSNPDGYEYTRQSPENRMWRKTMSRAPGSPCFGVDGNRNFGFKWAVSGVSSNPCDKETYAGSRPFSEIETQIVKNVMYQYRSRIKLYVSLHAYGQYLVYPWGYTGDRLPKTWKKLDKLARAVSASVVRAGGPPFRVMSAGKWYPAAGGSDDYAFGAIGVPYSYTMELTEDYEFIYPEHMLQQTLPKLYMGFRTFGREIKKEFGNNGDMVQVIFRE